MGTGLDPEKEGKGAEKGGEGVGRKVAKGGFRIRPTSNELGNPGN